MQKEANTLPDGMKVKRMREILRVKQEYLAVQMGLSQQAISSLEQRETIDMITLEKVAGILKVPVEAIQNFDEEKAVNVITNNSFDNCNQPASIFYNSVINPVDKWMEAIAENKSLAEDNKQLYERLLQSEKDKVDLIQKLLDQRR